MKKRLLSLLLTITLITSMLSMLFSCGGGKDNGDSSDQSDGDTTDTPGTDTPGTDTPGAEEPDSGTTIPDDGGGEVENPVIPSGYYIFAPGTSVTIVTNSESQNIDKLASKVSGAVGYGVSVVSDAYAKSEHEIIVGPTTRELSAKAYRYLERTKEDRENYVGYAVYSDGNSIAIAYDETWYQITGAEDEAYIYVLDELIGDKTTLKVNRAKVMAVAFDALEYQEAIDEVKQAEAWIRFETELAKITDNYAAIVEAYRYYYSNVCTDDAIDWLASLYDNGGFYFSNSGRDTIGYLTDVESTAQAVGFFKSTGMLLHDYEYPEWMADQVVKYVKGLQDENGYFYHPQWDRATLEANTQRMGRDLSNALGLLDRFGASPTYDTPNGYKGDGILPDGTTVQSNLPAAYYRLTYRLNHSVANAVSQVVLTAGIDGFAQLENEETYRAYLDEMVSRNKLPATDSRYRSFYQIANEICTNVSQILERDKQLKAQGANYSLADITVEWLSENQNQETGLWDEGLTYANTNAYYKAVNAYHGLEKPITLADKAIDSIITILNSDEPIDTVLYTFNVWGSLNKTMQNLDKYAATPEAKALRQQAREKLLELAPQAVMATAEAQLLFKKEDGSISYLIGKNTSVSQMMPVAVPNTDEGDVNSTTLTIGGILSSMLETMGLKGIAPTTHTRADGARCLSTMERLGEIVKSDGLDEVEYLTFEGEAVGAEPMGVVYGWSDLSNGSGAEKGHFKIVKAPLASDYENVAAEFKTNVGFYESLQVPTTAVSPNSTCLVFEGSFCVTEYSGSYSQMQILMQNAIYMVTIDVDENGVEVWESSSRKNEYAMKTELGAKAKLGEWFDIKIEYYIGDNDTVRIKLYFNGELIAVTDNYFDDTGVKLTGDGTPKSAYQYVNIIGVSSYGMTLQLDNLAAYATTAEYEPVRGVAINVDTPDRDRFTYDFEAGVHSDFTVNEGGGAVSAVQNSSTGSTALSLSSGVNGKSPYSVYLPINARTAASKVAIFESDVYVAEDASGTLLRIYFRENNTAKNALACFDLVTSQGSHRVGHD